MKKILTLLLFLNLLLNASDRIDTIAKIGDVVQIVIPVSAYATTLIIDDKEGEYSFYKSFASTFATTQTLKYTVREERPNGADNLSFPSGHTSASFQGAAFIHFRYGLKYAIVPYLGAAFVGYSRVVSDHHYTHDVVAGALIGTFFPWYFTKPYKVNDVTIEPVVYNSSTFKHNLYGVNITW